MLVDEEALAKQLEAHPELRAIIEHERALREQERTQFTSRIAELEAERDRLRASHERLRQELELFKRRLFIAKAERIDTRQLELEYAQKLRELDHLAGTLGIGKGPDVEEDDSALPAKDGKRRGKRKGNRGTGRRDLRALPLEEERIEIADPHLEALVAEGKVVRHGFEETCKIGHKRGGKRRIVIARVRYKTVDAAGNADVICKKSDLVGQSSQSAPRCPKWFDVSGGHYAATIFSIAIERLVRKVSIGVFPKHQRPWCGRCSLYSAIHASRSAWSSSMLA